MINCNNKLYSADNEYILCLKDCKECKEDCINHYPKLDDDINWFIEELNKRL